MTYENPNPLATVGNIHRPKSQAMRNSVLGHWLPGRFAWQMENIIALPEPIPYRGCQGLRDVRPDVLEILMELTNGA